MSKIMVLGGGGAVGRVAAKVLAASGSCSKILVADLDLARAQEVVGGIRSSPGACQVEALGLDVLDAAALRRALAGCSLVLNCAGPFYRLVMPTLRAVLDARINYVDICDDVDATLEILGLDQAAKAAGVTALIGMGSSPGATNLLARLACESFLDETEAIDIFHAHGGEPVEGAGVIGHRFHCMSIDIPMFLEGELREVRFFEPSGIALRQSFDFPVLGRVQLYPYPHPEQVTLPRHIRCRQVTNKGTVLPAEYYDLIRDLCAAGLASREPLQVGNQAVVPYDFAMAHILRERERILRRTQFGGQRGCVSVVVRGKKDGRFREIRFHLASQSQALGEGTGIPAAVGALLLLQGKVKGPGVVPPEAGVNPGDFIGMIPQVMALDPQKEGGKSFGGVILEQVDEHGRITKIDV